MSLFADQDEPRPSPSDLMRGWWRCYPCDVHWKGTPTCWVCGSYGDPEHPHGYICSPTNHQTGEPEPN